MTRSGEVVFEYKKYISTGKMLIDQFVHDLTTSSSNKLRFLRTTNGTRSSLPSPSMNGQCRGRSAFSLAFDTIDQYLFK